MPISRRMRVGGEIAITVVIAALALLLWPRAFGGATTIVIVHGNSMQPALDSGDLAIVRRADHYAVGDIVAYEIPQGQVAAGNVVIHRIVGVTDAGFVMRGDNRSSNDVWYPASSDVIGRVVAHLPIPAGERIWRLLPWLFGAMIGGGLVWLLWSRTADPEPEPDVDAEAPSITPDPLDMLSAAEPRWFEDIPANWAPPVPVPMVVDATSAAALDDFVHALTAELDSLSLQR